MFSLTDIGLSHGGRRRRGVLRGPCAAGADPPVDRELSDQEMVSRSRARRRRVLSLAVGCGSCDPTLVFHDGGGVDRGHGRPPCRDVSNARGGGDDRAGDCAGSAGASELPELEGIAASSLAPTDKVLENKGFSILACLAPGHENRTKQCKRPDLTAKSPRLICAVRETFLPKGGRKAG